MSARPAYPSVGLVANTSKPAVRALGPLLARIFASHRVRAYVLKHQRAAFAIPGLRLMTAQALIRRSRMILSLGGDGTMLEAVRLTAGSEVPVLGVNLGQLGFITPLPAGSLDEGLAAALRGRFRLELRAMIQAEILRRGRCLFLKTALNDVVLWRGASGKLALLEACLDGRYLAAFRADGLVVATPTGSTAYALAVGGPVVAPGCRNLLLAPIAPHTLSVRPLLLPDRSVLELMLPKGRPPLSVSVDGDKGFWLKPGDRLRVSRHRQDARLLVPPDYDYWDVLRQKLGWRGS